MTYDGNIKNKDLLALREYVTHDSGSLNKADSTVQLMVTHSNLKARFMEIRFDRYVSIYPADHALRRACVAPRTGSVFALDLACRPNVDPSPTPLSAPFLRQMTILRVKEKLMTHVGSNVSTMRLVLKDWDGATVSELGDDSKMLGYYSPEDGWTIHIIDVDTNSMSANGWLEDVSKVNKYMMSDEDYEAREGTYRQWKKEQLAKDPTWCLEKAMAEKRGEVWVPPAAPIEDDEHQAEEASAMTVGMRAEINPGGKRGEVKFVGKCETLPKGWWIGIQFDEPVGKNDGSAKGKRYFECPDGYGSFQRPVNVQVGDFPPVDDFDFSDDEI